MPVQWYCKQWLRCTHSINTKWMRFLLVKKKNPVPGTISGGWSATRSTPMWWVCLALMSRQLSSWPAVQVSDLLPLLARHENQSTSIDPCSRTQTDAHQHNRRGFINNFFGKTCYASEKQKTWIATFLFNAVFGLTKSDSCTMLHKGKKGSTGHGIFEQPLCQWNSSSHGTSERPAQKQLHVFSILFTMSDNKATYLQTADSTWPRLPWCLPSRKSCIDHNKLHH